MRAHQLQALEVDIDTRLAALWLAIGEPLEEADPELRKVIGDALRCAYGQGYTDALREPTRGQRCLDLGYAVPDTA